MNLPHRSNPPSRVVFFFARKYLFARGHPRMVHVISLLVILAFTVGVSAIFLVVNIFNGFDRLIREMYARFYPDAMIVPEKQAFLPQPDSLDRLFHSLADQGILQFCSVGEQQALLTCGEQRQFVTILALDSACRTLMKLDSLIVLRIMDKPLPQERWVILGTGVAYQLNYSLWSPSCPLKLYILSRYMRGIPAISPEQIFTTIHIRAGALFQVQQDIDLRYILMDYSFWRRLLKAGKHPVSRFYLWFPNLSPSEQEKMIAILKSRIRALCPDCTWKTREDLHQLIFQVLQMEKWMAFAILLAITVLSGTTLLSIQVLHVILKRRDIKILSAMGMLPSQMVRIFTLHGMFLCGVGWFLGTFFSLILTWLQQTYGFLRIQGTTFIIQAYPVEIRIEDYLLGSACILLAGFLFSWLPARLTRKISPVIRGE